MGSNETATATTGGPRVIDVLTGTGRHRVQITYFFRMQRPRLLGRPATHKATPRFEVIPALRDAVILGHPSGHYERRIRSFGRRPGGGARRRDVASTQIDPRRPRGRRSSSAVHCIFQRTDHNAAVVECTRTTASRSTRRPWARARARRCAMVMECNY